jgi:hypothetical protein
MTANRIRAGLTRRMRAVTRAIRSGETAAPVSEVLGYSGPRLDFQCNVCGAGNTRVPLAQVQNREAPSCAHCGSSLRMRSVVHALAMELFAEPLILPDFPVDPGIVGLGLSDWDGYAIPLASKLGYTNTFYHQEPRLDITNADQRWLGWNRFVICSDVFEHVPVGGLDAAFLAIRRLLVDGGSCIFTVPYQGEGETHEHFPRLHDYHFVEEDGTQVLHNTTAEGEHEVFRDLIFHGGDGATLEMRMFTESDLRRRFAAAGFSSFEVRAEVAPEFGILWRIDWALPIVLRA